MYNFKLENTLLQRNGQKNEKISKITSLVEMTKIIFFKLLDCPVKANSCRYFNCVSYKCMRIDV